MASFPVNVEKGFSPFNDPLTKWKNENYPSQLEEPYLFNYLEIKEDALLPKHLGLASRKEQFPLFSPTLTKNDLIKVFSKMNLISFVRARQSCNPINEFILDNSRHIKHKVEHFELVISPRFDHPLMETARSGVNCYSVFPYAAQILRPRGINRLNTSSWAKCEINREHKRLDKALYAPDIEDVFACMEFEFITFDLFLPYLATAPVDPFMDYLTRFLKVIQKRVTHLGISNYNKEAVQFLTHHFRPKELRLINAPANILSSPELIFCERITVVDDGNSRDSNWECNRVANDLLPLAQHFQSVVFRDHVGNGIPTRSDHLVLVQKLNGLLDNWINGTKPWNLQKFHIFRVACHDDYPQMFDMSTRPHILLWPTDHVSYGFVVQLDNGEMHECERHVYLVKRKHRKGLMCLAVLGMTITVKIVYNIDEFSQFLEEVFPESQLSLHDMAAHQSDDNELFEYMKSIYN